MHLQENIISHGELTYAYNTAQLTEGRTFRNVIKSLIVDL
jgi:hypothetical protein